MQLRRGISIALLVSAVAVSMASASREPRHKRNGRTREEIAGEYFGFGKNQHRSSAETHRDWHVSWTGLAAGAGLLAGGSALWAVRRKQTA